MNDTSVAEAKRAEAIANIRKLADWLESNADVPLPYDLAGQAQMASPSFHDGISPAEGVARVRSFAARHGVKVDESSHDRTSATVAFGRASYKLLTWHPSGRPGEPDERDAELERLRAEVAALRGDVGLDYSRADSEPDDPTPVSPARAPLHVGGLVDVTQDPGDPGKCNDCGDPLAWTGNVPQKWADRAGNRRIHAWNGRLGLPERPYDHEAR